MAEKTEAQKRAQKNYMEKFVRVEIRMDPGLRDKTKTAAEAAGLSVNGFIVEAVQEHIERQKTSGGDSTG